MKSGSYFERSEKQDFAKQVLIFRIEQNLFALFIKYAIVFEGGLYEAI